jgi:hypothetical protein
VKRDEKEGIIQRETQFDTNLVLARPTTLEVYTLQPRGINGRGDPNLTEVVRLYHMYFAIGCRGLPACLSQHFSSLLLYINVYV